jgi:hypothetical protein
MVLDPLERMIEKVKIIAANPMSAASEEINQAGIYCFAYNCENEQPKKKKFELAKVHNETECSSDSDAFIDEKIKDLYETEVLEKAIVKIGYLLAIGFGEAGSGIIGQNMTSSGSLNPMMPGKKTYCIFGFCILDQFVECTEVLQSDIMSYVNRVAEIAHSMVDRYGGSTNKNIGEAFLMVWKFYNPLEIEALDKAGKPYSNKDLCIQNVIISDLSVFSFLKIIAKLNKY